MVTYRDFYEKGLYKDLWFQWEGKPLIMADPDKVDDEIKDFFTFRKPVPSYFTGPDGPDQCGWLEVYPQHVFNNSRGGSGTDDGGRSAKCCGGKAGFSFRKGRAWTQFS